ncbi:hypothetical protein [Lysobacter tyrosinilyticus]
MQRPRIVIGSIAVALALVCANSMANPPTPNPQTFAAQRTTIEQELKEGGAYAAIDSAARAEVLAALQRISAVLDRNSDTSNLSSADQVQVFNDQELINSILTKAAKESRVVCERQVRRSSHISDTRCMTVAERRRQTNQAEETVRIIQTKGSPNFVPQGAGQ